MIWSVLTQAWPSGLASASEDLHLWGGLPNQAVVARPEVQVHRLLLKQNAPVQTFSKQAEHYWVPDHTSDDLSRLAVPVNMGDGLSSEFILCIYQTYISDRALEFLLQVHPRKQDASARVLPVYFCRFSLRPNS